MRRALHIVLLCLACAGVMSGEIVDRIVATVNGQPILQSDWEVAMRCEAFLDQRPLKFTPQAAQATLERLIDQELLRQQVRSYRLPPLTPKQLRSRMQEIRAQIPGGNTNAGWRAALERYGITEPEVEQRIADQLEITRFLDVRLRPTVHVSRRAVEEYYRDTLLPELKTKGAKEVPLDKVSSRIEEILSQQRMDSLVSDLLRELREQSTIRMHFSEPTRPPAATTAEDRR